MSVNSRCHVPRSARCACLPSVVFAAVIVSVVGLLGGVQAAQTETRKDASKVAAPAEPTAGAPAITEKLIQTRRKEVEDAKDLAEDVRTKALDLYRQAAEALQQATTFTANAADFKKRAANVDVRVKETKDQLETLKSPQGPQLPTALPELEQMLAQQQAALDTLKQEQSQFEGESARRVTRRKEIRERLFSAPERLSEIKKQLETPAPADESTVISAARKTAQLARQQALQNELEVLKQELALYDAEEAVEWVRLQRELKAQQVAQTEQTVKKLTERVNELRRQEAAKKLKQARQEKYRTHPLLGSYAEQNKALAEELHRLTQPVEDAKKELQEAQGTFEELNKQFEQTQKKVESVGRLTAPIGYLLRQERRSETLRKALAYRSRVETHADKSDEIHFELLKYDDQESKLFREKPELVDNVFQEAGPDLTDQQRRKLIAGLSEVERTELKQAADEILTKQQELLSSLVRSYTDYYDTLVNLYTTEDQLVRKADEYVEYINQRVLWIRSDRPLSVSELHFEDVSRAWFVSGEKWGNIGAVLWGDVRQAPVAWISALFLFASLVYLRRRLRAELKEIGEQARRSTFYRFAPSLRAALLTAVASIPVPGLFWYFAWRLSVAGGSVDSALQVAQGLTAVAGMLLPVEFVRLSCKPVGLADAHFHWSGRGVRMLRTNLHWFTLFGLPLVFIAATLHTVEAEPGWNTLERIVFLLLTVVLLVLVHRMLQPVRGLFHEWIAYHRGGWLDRLKYVWYGLGMLGPLTLAGLAWMGYYYTAVRLTGRLIETVGLILVLVYLRAFLLRWVLVNRRRISIEQARERRAAAQEEEAAAAESPEAVAAAPVEEPGADLDTISTQMQRLVGAGMAVAALFGLWLIWSDILPALNILNRWQIGHTTAADGSLEPVTAADLAVAILIGILTGVAARNVPGLLEMCLLQQLPLDASIRYAITRLASYAIVLAGLIFGFGVMGIGWSNVQWLAAALTFGLGFGLQEIFANFVSGLIILFERPIRVGDIVTLDGTTGIVSRIRIRATTITNWDRQELVVPNKEFITGRVLNWTLTNTINRIVLTVGVAYGSDIRKVRDILTRICREHPQVLDDPAPLIHLEEFADSSLNFVVRAYLLGLDYRLPTIHDLHEAFHTELGKAGIEIAFPQRDLHLRTIPDSLARDGRDEDALFTSSQQKER